MRALCPILLLTTAFIIVTVSSTAFAEDDQPPLWCLPDNYTAVEDVPVTYDMAEFVHDPDTPPENLSVRSDSPFVENITGMMVTFLFPNGVLEANVTIDVSDANATVGAVLHFLVEPVNDPPRFVPRYERLPDGEQEEFYSFNLTAVDEDNSPEELSYTTDATFFNIYSGEIAFTPNHDVVGYNFFNLSVSDPGGLSDTMQVLLLIGPYPVWNIMYIPPQIIQEDELWTLDISQYLRYHYGNTPPELRLTFTYRDDLTKIDTDPVTGLLTWIPTYDDVGDHFFTITVTDSEGRSDQQELKVTVEDPGPGPPPWIGRQILVQGVRYIYQVPVDPWYYAHPEIYEAMEYDNEPTDLFRVDPYSGIIDFVPGNEDVGEWEVKIIVTDSFGVWYTQRVVFEVRNANDPPTLASMGVQFLTEGEPARIELVAHDPDMDLTKLDPNATVDPDEVLTYSGGPPGASVDPVTGVLEFVPTQEHVNASPLMVSFTVKDAYGDSALIFVEIHVADVVTNPWVSMIGVVEGQKLVPGQRIMLRAVSVDESGSEWATSFRWYADDRLIGDEQVITWKVRGKSYVELSVVAEDEEGNRAMVNVSVLIKPGPIGDPGPIEVCIPILLVTAIVAGLGITLHRLGKIGLTGPRGRRRRRAG